MSKRWQAGGATVTLAAVLAACGPLQTPAMPTATAPGAVRASEEGSVQVTISFENLKQAQPDGALVFQVEMNTHSVDLDAVDLAAIATLTVEPGGSSGTMAWEPVEGSGHHISGRLTLPNRTPAGQPLVTAATSRLTIVLPDIGGVAERTFQWENDGWPPGF